MEKLTADKQPGDHVVFSCKRWLPDVLAGALTNLSYAVSGHGGQVNALADGNEIDHMDESSWILYGVHSVT